jgi:hypothetical protein
MWNKNTPKRNRKKVPKEPKKNKLIYDNMNYNTTTKDPNPLNRIEQKTSAMIIKNLNSIDIPRNDILDGSFLIPLHIQGDGETYCKAIQSICELDSHATEGIDIWTLNLVLLHLILTNPKIEKIVQKTKNYNLVDTTIWNNIKQSFNSFVQANNINSDMIISRLEALTQNYAIEQTSMKGSNKATIISLLSNRKGIAYNCFENILFATFMIYMFGSTTDQDKKNKINLLGKEYTVWLPTIWEDRGGGIDLILTDELGNRYGIDFTFLQSKEPKTDESKWYKKTWIISMKDVQRWFKQFKKDWLNYIAWKWDMIPASLPPASRKGKKFTQQFKSILS